MRFLFYSHDGLGLGHTRRHIAVATALVEMAPSSSVLLATGADDVNRLGLQAQVEVLKLPGLRKVGNNQYDSRRLRIPASEIRAIRSALLLATVNTFRPNVALVDKHPFGARGEFRAALEALKDFGGDILDESATVLKEWAPHNLQELITECYDRVLVYGHRAVCDPLVEYAFPAPFADRTTICGYVVNDAETAEGAAGWLAPVIAPNRTRPVVLATAGGGEDGFALLQTFARASGAADWEGAIVAGPMIPEAEFKTLQQLATEAKIALHAFVPSLASLFSSVDALVCMGGYNTLVEAVSRGVPTVCVPRTAPRSEQLIRAVAFERLGLVRTVVPPRLGAESLRQAVDEVLGWPRKQLRQRAHASLKFDGARQAASQLLALAAARTDIAQAS